MVGTTYLPAGFPVQMSMLKRLTWAGPADLVWKLPRTNGTLMVHVAVGGSC